MSDLHLAAIALLLAVVFVVVGLLTSHSIAKHFSRTPAAGLPLRMAAAMAGLFAGGAAAVVVGIGIAVLGRDRK